MPAAASQPIRATSNCAGAKDVTAVLYEELYNRMLVSKADQLLKAHDISQDGIQLFEMYRHGNGAPVDSKKFMSWLERELRIDSCPKTQQESCRGRSPSTRKSSIRPSRDVARGKMAISHDSANSMYSFTPKHSSTRSYSASDALQCPTASDSSSLSVCQDHIGDSGSSTSVTHGVQLSSSQDEAHCCDSSSSRYQEPWCLNRLHDHTHNAHAIGETAAGINTPVSLQIRESGGPQLRPQSPPSLFLQVVARDGGTSSAETSLTSSCASTHHRRAFHGDEKSQSGPTYKGSIFSTLSAAPRRSSTGSASNRSRSANPLRPSTALTAGNFRRSSTQSGSNSGMQARPAWGMGESRSCRQGFTSPATSSVARARRDGCSSHSPSSRPARTRIATSSGLDRLMRPTKSSLAAAAAAVDVRASLDASTSNSRYPSPLTGAPSRPCTAVSPRAPASPSDQLAAKAVATRTDTPVVTLTATRTCYRQNTLLSQSSPLLPGHLASQQQLLPVELPSQTQPHALASALLPAYLPAAPTFLEPQQHLASAVDYSISERPQLSSELTRLCMWNIAASLLDATYTLSISQGSRLACKLSSVPGVEQQIVEVKCLQLLQATPIRSFVSGSFLVPTFNSVVLVWRSAHPFSTDEWLHNLAGPTCQLKASGKAATHASHVLLHQHYYQSCLSSLDILLESYSETHSGAEGAPSLWLTGHSAGGAVAQCGLLQLLARKELEGPLGRGGLVTFGAPAAVCCAGEGTVAQLLGAQALDELVGSVKVVQFTNEDDTPLRLLCSADLKLPMALGTVVSLPDGGVQCRECCIAEASKCASIQLEGLTYPQLEPVLGHALEKHGMRRYCAQVTCLLASKSCSPSQLRRRPCTHHTASSLNGPRCFGLIECSTAPTPPDLQHVLSMVALWLRSRRGSVSLQAAYSTSCAMPPPQMGSANMDAAAALVGSSLSIAGAGLMRYLLQVFQKGTTVGELPLSPAFEDAELSTSGLRPYVDELLQELEGTVEMDEFANAGKAVVRLMHSLNKMGFWQCFNNLRLTMDAVVVPHLKIDCVLPQEQLDSLQREGRIFISQCEQILLLLQSRPSASNLASLTPLQEPTCHGKLPMHAKTDRAATIPPLQGHFQISDAQDATRAASSADQYCTMKHRCSRSQQDSFLSESFLLESADVTSSLHSTCCSSKTTGSETNVKDSILSMDMASLLIVSDLQDHSTTKDGTTDPCHRLSTMLLPGRATLEHIPASLSPIYPPTHAAHDAHTSLSCAVSPCIDAKSTVSQGACSLQTSQSEVLWEPDMPGRLAVLQLLQLLRASAFVCLAVAALLREGQESEAQFVDLSAKIEDCLKDVLGSTGKAWGCSSASLLYTFPQDCSATVRVCMLLRSITGLLRGSAATSRSSRKQAGSMGCRITTEDTMSDKRSSSISKEAASRHQALQELLLQLYWGHFSSSTGGKEASPEACTPPGPINLDTPVALPSSFLSSWNSFTLQGICSIHGSSEGHWWHHMLLGTHPLRRTPRNSPMAPFTPTTLEPPETRSSRDLSRSSTSIPRNVCALSSHPSSLPLRWLLSTCALPCLHQKAFMQQLSDMPPAKQQEVLRLLIGYSQSCLSLATSPYGIAVAREVMMCVHEARLFAPLPGTAVTDGVEALELARLFLDAACAGGQEAAPNEPLAASSYASVLAMCLKIGHQAWMTPCKSKSDKLELSGSIDWVCNSVLRLVSRHLRAVPAPQNATQWLEAKQLLSCVHRAFVCAHSVQMDTNAMVESINGAMIRMVAKLLTGRARRGELNMPPNLRGAIACVVGRTSENLNGVEVAMAVELCKDPILSDRVMSEVVASVECMEPKQILTMLLPLVNTSAPFLRALTSSAPAIKLLAFLMQPRKDACQHVHAVMSLLSRVLAGNDPRHVSRVQELMVQQGVPLLCRQLATCPCCSCNCGALMLLRQLPQVPVSKEMRSVSSKEWCGTFYRLLGSQEEHAFAAASWLLQLSCRAGSHLAERVCLDEQLLAVLIFQLKGGDTLHSECAAAALSCLMGTRHEVQIANLLARENSLLFIIKMAASATSQGRTSLQMQTARMLGCIARHVYTVFLGLQHTEEAFVSALGPMLGSPHEVVQERALTALLSLAEQQLDRKSMRSAVLDVRVQAWRSMLRGSGATRHLKAMREQGRTDKASQLAKHLIELLATP